MGKWEQLDKRYKHRIVIIILVLVFLLITILVGLVKCQRFGHSDVVPGVISVIAPSAGGNIQQEVNQKVEEGMFDVLVNTNVVMESGSKEANLLIQNSENNRYNFYVDVFSGDECIYHSSLIQPGYKIEVATLNRKLETGIYDCVAVFNIIDGSGEVSNKVNVNLTITVNE